MVTVSSHFVGIKSGLPVDAIPDVTIPTNKRKQLETKLLSPVGSMNWLAVATRPDIMTITNMIAQY